MGAHCEGGAEDDASGSGRKGRGRKRWRGRFRFAFESAGVDGADRSSSNGAARMADGRRGERMGGGDGGWAARSDEPSGKASSASHSSPVRQLALAEDSAFARETRAASATSASARIAPRGRFAPATRENIADVSRRRTRRNRASTYAVVRSPRAHTHDSRHHFHPPKITPPRRRLTVRDPSFSNNEKGRARHFWASSRNRRWFTSRRCGFPAVVQTVVRDTCVSSRASRDDTSENA